MLAITQAGKNNGYNTHNLYGMAESIATLPALKASSGKRGYVISRYLKNLL